MQIKQCVFIFFADKHWFVLNLKYVFGLGAISRNVNMDARDICQWQELMNSRGDPYYDIN